MSLEFNNPLYIGDKDAAVKSDIAELQSEVGDLSQLETGDKSSLVNALNEAMDSTLNGASRDLDNLSDVGNNKLRSLNSYANEGELLTDAEGLADVENYAHSTFDRSKFTVVGSPNITNDGIAQFASGDAIYTNININSGQKTIIEFDYTYKTSSAVQILWIAYPSPSDQTELSYAVVYTNGTVEAKGSVSTNTFTSNQKYHIKCVTDFATYNDLYVDGELWCHSTSTNSQNIGQLYIANRYNTNRPVVSPFDLKGINISVDGIPVFSGNKTGIDTIKPDDYTVVGTPAIAQNGVASGFTSSNYITTPSVTTTDNYEIHFAFYVNTLSGTIQYIFTNNSTAWVSVRADKTFRFGVKNGTTTFEYCTSTLTATEKTLYTGKAILKNSKIELYLAYNDIPLTKIAENDITITPASLGSLRIGENEGNPSGPFEGSIDLNAFKIYVDSDLVYQPCLKIPYTESKTGSKIVNSIYRDRVADMSAQFGFANYYTLSDTDFTLPQVELYGLIGQRTLRDSYRNGINYWELYSNRDLEQGGSCTSGVEVTFARPFADTNYVLSVPYSAKSATAFTPTQTGDWIAKGKGIL